MADGAFSLGFADPTQILQQVYMQQQARQPGAFSMANMPVQQSNLEYQVPTGSSGVRQPMGQIQGGEGGDTPYYAPRYAFGRINEDPRLTNARSVAAEVSKEYDPGKDPAEYNTELGRRLLQQGDIYGGNVALQTAAQYRKAQQPPSDFAEVKGDTYLVNRRTGEEKYYPSLKEKDQKNYGAFEKIYDNKGKYTGRWGQREEGTNKFVNILTDLQMLNLYGNASAKGLNLPVTAGKQEVAQTVNILKEDPDLSGEGLANMGLNKNELVSAAQVAANGAEKILIDAKRQGIALSPDDAKRQALTMMKQRGYFTQKEYAGGRVKSWSYTPQGELFADGQVPQYATTPIPVNPSGEQTPTAQPVIRKVPSSGGKTALFNEQGDFLGYE